SMGTSTTCRKCIPPSSSPGPRWSSAGRWELWICGISRRRSPGSWGWKCRMRKASRFSEAQEMLSPNTPVDEAEVVIVGGGLLGASAAWHLTRAGVSDVLLLERNDIATGASCRSAGMFNHTRSDINSIRMISRTRQAISELEDLLGEDVGF